jgi:type IV pilus assembly protein PilM
MAVSKTVGLDIGSQLIKVVELSSSPRDGLSISAMGVAPTPPGVFQNGMLTDPSAMGLAVRQLVKDSKITSRRVVGCITGQSSVVVRIIEVPRMTPA